MEFGLFNECFANIIFICKNGFIGVVTICGFGAVQFFHASHVYGVMNYLVVLDSLLLFYVLYDKGFVITRLYKVLKDLGTFRLKALSLLTKLQFRGMMRQVKSLRVVPLRVGSFHHLQRNSTAVFLDFSVKNAARLVIAYRKR